MRGLIRVVHSDKQAELEPTFAAAYQYSVQAIRFALTAWGDPESDVTRVGFELTWSRPFKHEPSTAFATLSLSRLRLKCIWF